MLFTDSNASGPKKMRLTADGSAGSLIATTAAHDVSVCFGACMYGRTLPLYKVVKSRSLNSAKVASFFMCYLAM